MTKRDLWLKLQQRVRSRGMLFERLEDRSLLASDFQNPINRLDVDDSGLVTPLDALVVINALGRDGSHPFSAATDAPPPYLDVNGSGYLEPLDALAVINYLNLSPEDVYSLQKFHVDVTTGQVNVGPVPMENNPSNGSEGESRFVGSTVVFNSSQLIDQPGDVGRKVLNVSLTNRSGEPLGQLSNGTITGLRVLFSPLTNVSEFSDARPRTEVITVAGTGASSSIDGPVGTATFSGPTGMAVDGSGNIYVTEFSGNRVRKISNGFVSTLAGNGTGSSIDGSGTAATFNNPWGIARNPIDGALIVTDYSGNRVWRLDVDGTVTTIAGTGAVGDANGSGAAATFRNPAGVTVDDAGTIYLVESAGQRVRKIVKTGGDPRLSSNYNVSVMAGSTASPPVAGFADGVGSAARFNQPRGVTVDSDGTVYVADSLNNRVRRVSATGEVVTIAGAAASGNVDGLGHLATLNFPQAISLIDDTTLLVADSTNNTIRQITLRVGQTPASASSWQVATIAGTGASGAVDGTGNVATFNAPKGLAVDSSRNVFVADFGSKKIRRVTPTNGFFPLGNATGSSSSEPVQLSNPDGVVPLSNPVFGVIGSTGQMPFIQYDGSLEHDQTSDVQGWSFVVPSGVTAFEFTVSVEANTRFLAQPFGVSNAGPLGVGSPLNFVRTVAGRGLGGFVDGDATEAKFNSANGIAVDKFGNRYVADTSNHSIRRVAPDGTVTTVAGVVGKGAGSVDGTGTFAQFNGPRGVAVTDDGQTLYVTDSNNHTIRRIALAASADPTRPSSWTVSTIAGFVGDATYADGPGGSARFNFPVGIAVSSSGIVYLSEFSGNRIRRLHHNGGNPALNSSWIASLVAGSSVSPVGTAGTTNGFGTSARFDLPAHIAVDQAGNIYVADVNNSRIRKIDPDSNVSTLAGSTFGYHDDVGASAQFGQPNGVAVDSAGYVWVADTSFHRIRRISPTGVVTTVAGTGDTFPGDLDGTGNVARFYFPLGIDVDDSGSLHLVSGGTYQFEGGGGVTSPGLRIRLIERIFSVGE